MCIRDRIPDAPGDGLRRSEVKPLIEITMKTTSVTIYSTGCRETRTYLAAALFAAGNIALPQLCHLVQLGGPTMLPIYFFTLVGAYKYGWRAGLLTALASPLSLIHISTW